MKVESQIDFIKYRNVLFLMTYRRPIVVLINLFGLISLIYGEMYYYGLRRLYISPPVIPFIFGSVFVFVWPIIIFIFARQSYYRNIKMLEIVIYNFDEAGFIMIGSTFSATVKWEAIEKVEELKNWIIIYHRDKISNTIPKNNFGNNLDEFKELVKQSPDIKTKFRR